MILVVTHAKCADGFTAAKLFEKYTKDLSCEEEIIIFEWDLRAVEIPHLQEAKKIVYLDCFPSDSVLSQAKVPVTVIDHHVTNDEKRRAHAEEFTHLKEYLYDVKKCASQLVCDYFHIAPPWIVEHVADKDLWTWKNPASRPIMRALEIPYDLEAVINDEEAQRSFLFVEGSRLLAEDEANYADLLSTIVKGEVLFENVWHPVNVIYFPSGWNSGYLISELGARAALGVGMAMLVQEDGRISCRSSSEPGAMNCAKFCELFGRGGHEHSAAFHLPNCHSGIWPEEFFKIPAQPKQE
jgi:oligoribonuclease NrnB/cAMP/cGMP phosphodiesterase (DHH superfamily)